MNEARCQYLSVWSRAGLSLPEIFAQVSEVGLRYVDVFGREHGDPHLLQKKNDMVVAAEDALRTYDLLVVSYGALTQRNPADMSHKDENLLYMRACMELAVRWNCKQVLLDTGERERGVTNETAWANLRTFARQCADIAEDLGVFLTLELEPYGYSVVNSLEKVVRLVDEVASPAVFVNVDTGHLNVLRVEASELPCLSGLVVHAHLTDNLGNIDSHDEIGLGNAPNA